MGKKQKKKLVQKTSKYKKSELTQRALLKFYQMESINNDIDINEVRARICRFIITELYNSGMIHDKMNGMCYRNNIPIRSKIGEDILQETFMELSRYDQDDLFLAYCDNPRRIVALATSIATRTGFRDMKTNDTSIRRSVAKHILHTSNIQKQEYLCTVEGSIVHYGQNQNGDTLEPIVDIQIDLLTIDTWKIIRDNLDTNMTIFLNFLLEHIFSKKIPTYSKKIVGKYYSYSEYKINTMILKNTIKDILIKNKIKI